MEHSFPGFDRIVTSPDVCAGKPRIKGTRFPVASVLANLASGLSTDEFLAEFHWLTRDDVLQSLSFGAMMLNDEYVPFKMAA